jgi:hypothetical protein
MTFFKALIISGLIHSLLILPYYTAEPIVKTEEKKPISVEYVHVKEYARTAIDMPRVNLEKKVEMRPPKELKSEGDLKREARDDYINYYQLIREKVRREVKDRYTSYNKDGEVALNFILNSDGTLASHDIDADKSTRDEELVHIASVSLVSAAPFQQFPKGLSVSRMSFSLVIEFRKK